MAYTPVQPDSGAQTGTPYKAAIEGSIGAHARIAGMFAPHEQASPNMTVRLDAGALWVSGGVVEVAAQSTSTITAPTGTDHRIDRMVIDADTGAVSVITGTPGGSPVAPAITTGKLPICQVALAHGMTVITNDLITDERIVFVAGSHEDILVGDLYITFNNYADSAAVATAKGYGTWIPCGFGRMLVGFGNASIVDLSRAAACVVTWPSHGFNNGETVVFSGITQAEWTALNGSRVITRINSDSFSIPVNTSGYAAAYEPNTDPGIYSAGSEFDTGEKTGGAKTKDIVSHTHPTPAVNLVAPNGIEPALVDSAVPTPGIIVIGGSNTYSGYRPTTIPGTSGSCSSAAQDVLNPYMVVYMWKRTA